MDILRMLRLRAEGCETGVDYDSVLSKFKCTSHTVPPPDFVDSRLLSCAFARKEKQGHILAVTCEEGQIIVVNTKPPENKDYSFCVVDNVENMNALFSAQWSEIDMKLITTSGDHAVGLWNLTDDCRLTKLNSFKAHRCTVKTACFKPQNSDIFASGARDGNIYVWDSRKAHNSKPEQYINNCHKKVTRKHENASITCIVYQDDFRLISCADADPHINVWDLRKTYLQTTDKPVPVYQLPSPKKNCFYGYTHMVTDKNCTKLYANSLGHNIYCYNISAFSKKPENIYYGHSVRNFFSKLSLSPDNKYVASTDSDDKIFIWKIRSPGTPISKLSGNPEMLKGLSDISWCPEDHLKLATSSDFPAPWIWTVPPSNEDSTSSSHDSSNEDWDFEKISSAECLRIVPVECKQNSAMTSKLFQNRKQPYEAISPMKLPNSVIDGSQIHTCCAIERKPIVIKNWLTNLHNQKTKSSGLQELLKTPSPIAKSKIKKRKRTSMSPGNNLNKYFKKQDENLATDR